MKRLPVLIGANPRTANTFGPQVPVGDGLWRVVMEGVADTRLRLHYDSTILKPVNLDGMKVEFEGPIIVRTEIVHRGTENHISVFVERQG